MQLRFDGINALNHPNFFLGGSSASPHSLYTTSTAFVTNAAFVGLGQGYDLHATPEFSASLFATYDRRRSWGLTGGVTYNSWTGGSIPGRAPSPPAGPMS